MMCIFRTDKYQKHTSEIWESGAAACGMVRLWGDGTAQTAAVMSSWLTRTVTGSPPPSRRDRRPLGDPAQHGASGSSSARFAPAPPASGGPPAGGTVMEKAMHMRAGAPQMNYKVKLSDV